MNSWTAEQIFDTGLWDSGALWDSWAGGNRIADTSRCAGLLQPHLGSKSWARVDVPGRGETVLPAEVEVCW